MKFRQHDDQLRCLGAGILLHRVLGVEHDDDLLYGPYGKPFLANGGPEFSLSHAGEYVILVTHDTPVGVDIEPITPEHDEAFLREWTAREAIMKLTGLGLQLGPESINLNTNTYKLEHYTINNHIYCTAVLSKM